MTTIQDPILDAAIGVFAKYGIRRATMQDVAQAAQVSRQTLYGHYGGKDQIVSSTIHYMTARVLSELRKEWAESDEIGAQLWAFMQRTTVDIYEMTQKMPDAEDIISGANAAARTALTEAETLKTHALAQRFAPFAANLQRRGMTEAQLARFVVASCIGAKHSAQSLSDLETILQTLHCSVMGVLDQSTCTEHESN